MTQPYEIKGGRYDGLKIGLEPPKAGDILEIYPAYLESCLGETPTEEMLEGGPIEFQAMFGKLFPIKE